jgi:hypothetical protein
VIEPVRVPWATAVPAIVSSASGTAVIPRLRSLIDLIKTPPVVMVVVLQPHY